MHGHESLGTRLGREGGKGERRERGEREEREIALFQDERAGNEEREQIRVTGRLRSLVSGPQSPSLCLL